MMLLKKLLENGVNVFQIYIILYLGGVEVSGVKTEKDYFEAIKIIDRHLHPSGPLAKSPAAFFLYEVNNDVAIYMIMVNKH